jgi:hypothetical protein
VALLARVLTDTPKLPGAACRDRSGPFDPESGSPAAALNICQRCPALRPCAEWADTAPNLRGVVAGAWRGPRIGRGGYRPPKTTGTPPAQRKGDSRVTTEPDKQVSLSDCQTAAIGLLHFIAADIEGLEAVLEPIQNSRERSQAVLLGLLQVVRGAAPELRQPDRIEWLRSVVAKMSAREDDTGGDGPLRLY